MANNIYFLRHLRTASNKLYINGQSLSTPIEKEQPIQCLVNIEYVFCSDALRCRQTMDCYFRTNKIVPIQYTDQLYERNMGSFEGQLRSVIIEKHPDQFSEGKFNVFSTPPFGESFEAFQHRANCFMKLADMIDKDILICSHNQFLKMLYFVIHDITITQRLWNSMNFPFGEIILVKKT